MDGPGGHYAKWNKSEKDTHCMMSLICGVQEHWTQKQRVEWCLQGLRGRGNGGDIGQSVQTCSYKMNTFWGSKV